MKRSVPRKTACLTESAGQQLQKVCARGNCGGDWIDGLGVAVRSKIFLGLPFFLLT